MSLTTPQSLKRPKVEALDSILGVAFPVLDHGFVRVVDYMGDDAAIVQAARCSYGQGTSKLSDDEALINYLLRHAHTTPFEMCELKLHCKLPMFVARQWIRHRTASVNEYSARYSILKDEFYVPEKDNVLQQSLTNKQGREGQMDSNYIDHFLALNQYKNNKAYTDYIRDTDKGMARELARINLPVSIYTEWYWKVNLHNLMHFLKLRADSHAQKEIRVYADVIVDIMKQWVPMTHAAWLNHSFNSVKFSGKVMDALKKSFLFANQDDIGRFKTNLITSGVKEREYHDVLRALSLEK